jgi:hypothetical protein
MKLNKFLPSLCFLLIFSFTSLGKTNFWTEGNYKFRARESYEWLQFKSDSQKEAFQGLSNTINFFYEKPFDYSYGLAAGSLFSGLSSENGLPGLSRDIDIFFIGFEGKLFFFGGSRQGLFTRPGLFFHQIQNDGARGNIDGVSLLTSLGYEFFVYKDIALAPEIAFKSGESGPYSWQGLTLSLGLHFYQF